jgi:hypothetical protein
VCGEPISPSKSPHTCSGLKREEAEQKAWEREPRTNLSIQIPNTCSGLAWLYPYHPLAVSTNLVRLRCGSDAPWRCTAPCTSSSREGDAWARGQRGGGKACV